MLLFVLRWINFHRPKTLAKYEDITLLKSSNKTCFQNTIKVLLCSDLVLYMCNSNDIAIKKKWFTRVMEIATKCIQVYQPQVYNVKRKKDTGQNII